MNLKKLLKTGKLFDSHCHLNSSEYDSIRDEVVEAAKKAGIEAIIDMGVSVGSSKKAITNAKKYDCVYASIGIDMEILVPDSDLFDRHVFDLDDKEFEEWLEVRNEELEAMTKEEKVIMIGETGIDNYWLTKRMHDRGEMVVNEVKRSLVRQELLFRMHIKLAKKKGLPLSIHSRNAINMCLKVLEEEDYGFGIFHSLTPDINDTEEDFYNKVNNILDRGLLIGVNGIITFKNAQMIRRVYRRIVQDKSIETPNSQSPASLYQVGFVLETDGPFLAPEPYRGRINRSDYIERIYHKFAASSKNI